MESLDQKSFPLEAGRLYIEEKKLRNIESELDLLSKDFSGKDLRMLKKATIIIRLEEQGLFDDFISKYWKNGKTDAGKNKIKQYKNYMERLKSCIIDPPKIIGSSFAYETDLRDFLANNLTLIEPDLKLFKKDDIDGVEYSVDINHKRIDILAIDKNNIPVILELKVSQGYEQVIGQCQYYRNKIKEIFNSENVRVIIIARKITDHLRIATKDLKGYQLFEYIMKVDLKEIG